MDLKPLLALAWLATHHPDLFTFQDHALNSLHTV